MSNVFKHVVFLYSYFRCFRRCGGDVAHLPGDLQDDFYDLVELGCTAPEGRGRRQNPDRGECLEEPIRGCLERGPPGDREGDGCR